MIPFYLITNAQMLIESSWVQSYPRHLLLAPVLAARQDMLTTARHLRKTRKKSIRIILDNGAYEGSLMASDEYMHMAKELRPHVVVLPDLVGEDWERSASISEEFMAKLRTQGDWGRDVDVMYVPQGRTQEENKKAYRWAINVCDPRKTIIGLGKSYLLWHTSAMPEKGTTEHPRIALASYVARLPNANKFRFHLLGARPTASHLYNSMHILNHINISGLDSYKPFKAAYKAATNLPGPAHTSADLIPDALLDKHVTAFCELWGLTTKRT